MKQVSQLQLFSVILWPPPQFHVQDLIPFNRNNKYDIAYIIYMILAQRVVQLPWNLLYIQLNFSV